jgi:hypothetical protein
MNTSRLVKCLYSGGRALVLCALALTARAQYSNAVLGLNPILYYHLNDTTPVPGSLWTNWGTAGFVGTAFALNSPDFQQTGALPADSPNYGAGFNLTSTSPMQYAAIPYSAAIDPSQGNPQAPFTVEGWFNPALASPGPPYGDGSPVSYINANQPTGWSLYQDARDGWLWQLYSPTGAGGYLAGNLASSSTPTPGTFDYVVLVWDGTNASMYLDGALVDGPIACPTYEPMVPAPIVTVGGARNDLAGGFAWQGVEDEVAIYTNALSASNILAHYQNGTNLTPAQSYESLVLASRPLLYYKFNDPAYVDPTPGTYPLPNQPGQPKAQNLGSLGTNYDATYEAGSETAIPGAPYAGFGSESYAVEFDGISDITNFSSVEIPALATVTSTPNFTFTCWFYNNNLQQGTDPLMWQQSGTNDTTSAMGLWFFDASQLETIWNGQDYGVSFSNQDPPVAAWSFIASVWTPSNTTIYVNGVAQSISSTHAPRDLSIGPIVLGDDRSDGHAVNGLMQEVAMFTDALSAAQIQSLYNAGGQPPTITELTQTPAGPTNFGGQTITFSVSAYGSGPLTYTWFENSLPLSGQSGANLVLNNLAATNAGGYFVVVSNPYGAATSSVAVLNVLAGPPVITQQPSPAAVTRYLNGHITFAVAAEGTVPISYQWQYNNAPISGATSTSLTLTALTAANAGIYNAVVANPVGTNTSSNAVLTVAEVPTNYASVMMALGPQAYWPLHETSGTVAYDYSGGYNGTITAGVTLGQPGAPYPGLSGASNAFVLDGLGGYVNTPLLLNGWEGTFTALIDLTGIVYVPGIMHARGGPGIDCGIGLYTDGVTLQYVWENAVNTWNWYTTTSETGMQVPLNTWCFLAASVGSNQTIIYLDNGTGLVSETNDVASLEVTNTGPLFIGYDPQINLGVPAGYATNDYFEGGISDAAFFNRALSPAEIMALDHTLIGGAPVGEPTILNQPVAQSAFAGSASSFTVSAVGALPLSYQWQLNSNNIPGATGQTLVIPTVEYNSAGFYTVIVSNSISASNSQPVPLTVLDPPISANVTYELVAHYKFDGDCTDSSGNENNGFPENSPQFVAGHIGSGAIQVSDNLIAPYEFPYVSLADPTAFQFNAGDSFSVSLWLNYTGTPGDLPIIGNAQNSTGNTGWVLADSFYNDGGGNITCSIEGFGGSAYFVATNHAGPMNDGNWHHLVFVSDQINSVCQAYTDGALDRTVSANLGSLNTGNPTAIGNDPTGTYTGANAAGGYTIDDVGIWRRALTLTDVQSIYAAGTASNSFDTFGPVQLATIVTGTGQLQLSWQQGTLQSTTNLAGIWTNVPGATPPVYVVTPSGSQNFYRVQ